MKKMKKIPAIPHAILPEAAGNSDVSLPLSLSLSDFSPFTSSAHIFGEHPSEPE